MSDRLDDYITYFERLSPDRLDDLDALVMPDVRFKDPFNDVHGAVAMKKALAMAFEHGTPRFEVIDRARGERAAYLLWRYVHGTGFAFEGMTEIRLAPDGRIAEHIDHWDSGSVLYAHVPVLGWFVRLVRDRLKVRG
ncbi:MAG: nuclear transport factor 2 family protein [Alphaproteobacteria bacterium]|nr:nuclear transport factor 2 family protein [Alphaproteobacteria bacterium]